VQSFTVTGANMQNATVHFTLSGDYTITMTVTDPQGNVFTCTWVQHVIGPGVRFELCWDHTGKSGMGGADLDLHVHKPGSTTKWFGMPMKPNLDDCNFSDCNPDAWILNCGFGAGNCSKWGYAVSALAQCSGAPPTENGSSWANDNAMCPNPRLDLDNIDIVGRPENANIDDPKNGDTFRAMVHYYGQDSSISINNVEEHPIVNIYCGGTLKSTFGQAPNTLTGFNNGAGWAAGLMWRVADVTAVVDNMGNTTDCTVTQLHPNGQNMGFDVTTNDTTY
jgi:hypothetical protein